MVIYPFLNWGSSGDKSHIFTTKLFSFPIKCICEKLGHSLKPEFNSAEITWPDLSYSKSKKLMFLHDQDSIRILCHTQNSTMPLTWWRNLTIEVRMCTWQVLLLLNISLVLWHDSPLDFGTVSVVKVHVQSVRH